MSGSDRDSGGCLVGIGAIVVVAVAAFSFLMSILAKILEAFQIVFTLVMIVITCLIIAMAAIGVVVAIKNGIKALVNSLRGRVGRPVPLRWPFQEVAYTVCSVVLGTLGLSWIYFVESEKKAFSNRRGGKLAALSSTCGVVMAIPLLLLNAVVNLLVLILLAVTLIIAITVFFIAKLFQRNGNSGGKTKQKQMQPLPRQPNRPQKPGTPPAPAPAPAPDDSSGGGDSDSAEPSDDDDDQAAAVVFN